MKNFIVITCLLLMNFLTGGATNEVEKFTPAADIVTVQVNGKRFKVHEQNYVAKWNAAPNGRPVREIELKNLMITGTFAAGITVTSMEVITAEKSATATFFADRNCTRPCRLIGATVMSGEQVYYVKVLAPDGNSFQVYTLSIMGLSKENHAQYYKYGEPTYVADSYQTWMWALHHATPGQIIAVTKIEQYLCKPGEYQHMPDIDKQDLVIRSLSGSYEDLILVGHGFHKGAYRGGLPRDVLFQVKGVNVKNIVVYGITTREATASGFKLEGLGEENVIFDNCRIIDANERAFKGSGPQIDGKFTRSRNISIINCWFECTQVPLESDHSAEFTGDYIGGIDVMNLDGLTIAGNTFKNIVGKNGGGRGAIFIWGQDGCRDVLIENNLIINCDRGIALGNPSGDPSGNSSGGFYVNCAVIRNNVICNSSNELIEINRLNDVKIYNNTLWKTNVSGKGIRDSGGEKDISHYIAIINNIVCGAVNEFPCGNHIDIRHNLFSFNDPSGVVQGEGNVTLSIPGKFFVNVDSGDFRLRESSTQAFRKGIQLAEVETDFVGTPRGLTPDLGAYQYLKPSFSLLK